MNLGRGTRQLVLQEGVVIFLMICAHHKHGGIKRRGREDDFLGSTLRALSLLPSGDPSGLHNIFSISIIPFDIGGISLPGDGLSLDDRFPVLNLDCGIEFVTGGIILEHVYTT